MAIKPKYSFGNKLFILVHPGMIALYVFLIVLYFAPNYFEKYTAEIIDIKYLKDYEKYYYHDLDGDGISEKIVFGYNTKPENNDIKLQHFLLNDNVLGQENFNGSLLDRNSLIFGDYDLNGYAETYFFILRNDSVFLEAKELMLEKGLNIKDRFISLAGTYDRVKYDIKDVGGVLINDSTNSCSELIFTFYAGYSKYPRNTFVYNIQDDSLKKSPASAAGFFPRNHYMDLDQDGHTEITGAIAAHENIHYDYPYTDSACWLMVLNTRTMGFQFPPIRFDLGMGSWVHPVFFDLNDKKYIVITTYSTKYKGNENKSSIQVYDDKGILINKKRNLGAIKDINAFNPLNNKQHFYFIDKEGHIYQSDTSLDIKRVYKNELVHVNSALPEYEVLDIDNNGSKEVLYVAGDKLQNRYLTIFDSEFSNPSVVHLFESKMISRWHAYLIEDGNDKNNILFFQAENTTYKIQYQKNPYYLLKYPFYILVYSLLFLLFWLLQKAQNTLAKRRFEIEKQLIHQQLAISKNQMEPHFMLNTLNNIGYLFTKDDKQQAMYYFGKFAALIRRGLMYADKVETTLEKEIEFIEDYLILQKHLMDGELDYIIENKEDVDLEKIKVPHSLIYTFVENAIKHGLRPKEKDRVLKVEIIKGQNDRVKITITDNGIGRKKSKQLGTTDTGKGMKIVKSIVGGYNKLYGGAISYEIRDVQGKGDVVLGTEVVVLV